MKTFEDLVENINRTIEKEIYNRNFEPKNLYEPVKYILKNGGKRIRPAIALMAANLFTEDIEPLYKPALALEVFHNFTLLHDDIMDDSPVRRGKDTVHVKWNNNTAILSGDAMAILAYKCLENVEDDKYSAVMNVFNQSSLEVCEGQQYDMDFEQRQDVSTHEYLKMINLKTAVLLAASLKIGAILGGAKETEAQDLYDLGINMGMAFQLKDDWLDVYGDFEKFGKRIGNDIIENKKTYLLLRAFEKAEGTTLVDLKKLIFENQTNLDEKVRKVTTIFNELEVSRDLEKLMNLYTQKAIDILDNLKVDEVKKIALRKITQKILFREN